MTLNKNVRAFVVNISRLIAKITIHLSKKAKISWLLIDKVIFLAKYLKFADIFLKMSAKVIPK